MAKKSSGFYLGQFGKGLITGLVFGLIFSALLAWMVNSRQLPKEQANPALDCRACLSGIGQSTASAVGVISKSFESIRHEPIVSPYGKVAETPSTSPNSSATPPSITVRLVSQRFTKLADIEEIKADLAINGVDSKMVVSQGQYRLELGPYPSIQVAERVKNDLGEHHKLFSLAP